MNSSIRGKVNQTNEENSTPRYRTSSNDPILVVAQCTKVPLEHRILTMAKTVQPPSSSLLASGNPPTYNFNSDHDLIATTTTEAPDDLTSKITFSCEKKSKIKVRTIASIPVNGAKDRPNSFWTRPCWTILERSLYKKYRYIKSWWGVTAALHWRAEPLQDGILLFISAQTSWHTSEKSSQNPIDVYWT